MYSELKSEMMILSGAYAKTEDALDRRTFYNYVSRNYSRFDSNDWKLFITSAHLDVGIMREDRYFWETIEPVIKEMSSKNKFSFLGDIGVIRVKYMLLLINEMKTEILNENYSKTVGSTS